MGPCSRHAEHTASTAEVALPAPLISQGSQTYIVGLRETWLDIHLPLIKVHQHLRAVAAPFGIIWPRDGMHPLFVVTKSVATPICIERVPSILDKAMPQSGSE